MKAPTLNWFVNDIKRINEIAPKRRKKDMIKYRWLCHYCGKMTEEYVSTDDLPYRPFCWHCRSFQHDANGHIMEHNDMDEISWRQYGAFRDYAADGNDGIQRIGQIGGTHPNDIEDWYGMPRGALGKRKGLYLSDKQKKKVKDAMYRSFVPPDPIA